MGQRPSGISVKIREDLMAGSARTQTTLICDPIITLDGHRLTTSDIGDICFAKLDQGTSNEEIISFTGITDNTTTYTLTGCVWGYNFYNTTGSVEANKKRHTSGGGLLITNDDHYLATQYVNADSNQTIAGVKTFSSVPQTSAGDPTTANELTRKGYVDALVLGTLTTINVIVPGKAGETISAAGKLVYFDDTDNEWKLCDADTATTVQNVLLGISQGAGTNGNAISGGVLLQGVDANQSGLTEGDIYYASNTPGSISNSAGTTEVTVGIGKSATELYFNPRFNQQLTEDQQDALTGTSGTPSSTNKYVTNDDTAENTASKLVRRQSNGDIAGLVQLNTTLTAGETINGATTPTPIFFGENPTEQKLLENTTGNSDVRVYGTNWKSQTFTTSSTTRKLSKFSIYARSIGSQRDCVLALYDTSAGKPYNPITSISFNTFGNQISSSYEDVVLDISNVEILPSTMYAIVVYCTSGDSGNCIEWREQTSDIFANGTEVGSADSGNTWTISSSADFRFAVYGYTNEKKVWMSDANNLERLRFDGFATSNAIADASINVATAGLVSNFTGLTSGSLYYVQDSVGTIGTTPGTYGVLVGRASSTTQLLIQPSEQLVDVAEVKWWSIVMPKYAQKAVISFQFNYTSQVWTFYRQTISRSMKTLSSIDGFSSTGSPDQFTKDLFTMSLSGDTITINISTGWGPLTLPIMTVYYYR